MLLFKGPVRGACCALPRHGFRGFVWEFCYNFRPFAIFNAGSLALSVDSATFSFLVLFDLYVCIRPCYIFCFFFFSQFCIASL